MHEIPDRTQFEIRDVHLFSLTGKDNVDNMEFLYLRSFPQILSASPISETTSTFAPFSRAI